MPAPGIRMPSGPAEPRRMPRVKQGANGWAVIGYSHKTGEEIIIVAEAIETLERIWPIIFPKAPPIDRSKCRKVFVSAD